MMTLNDILKGQEFELVSGQTDIAVRRLQFDSRKVGEGDVFVAVPGTHVDGHLFISKAIEQGAAAVVAEKFANSDNLTSFINDTLTDKQKITALENKVKQYEDVYGTNNILNNDLENKISYAEDALTKLSDQYVVDLENANPGGNNVQISIDAIPIPLSNYPCKARHWL